MSTVYTGNAANVSNTLAATINGATNASPIVISTTASHLFATNDQVTITGVTGNTAANGVWTIIVISSTTFSLTSSTGNGAYVSGGLATDNSLTPQFTIPSDGDARSAASVNVALQALADRTQMLAINGIERTDVYTSNGTWTPGPGTTRAVFEMCGGGGGGGAGDSGGTGASPISACSGGGGGGAPYVVQTLQVTPGTTYAVTVGVGGTNGVDGTDSSVAGLIVAPGGQAGGIASGNGTTNTLLVAQGGAPVRNAPPVGVVVGVTGLPQAVWHSKAPGSGGVGANVPGGGVGSVGLGGVVGFAGGARGNQGTIAGTAAGGVGGGGGGGGPFGAGGSGGNGGNGSNTAAAATNGAGGSSAGGLGAGGGGGGSGGMNTGGGSAGSGGVGGTGGNGLVRIRYYGPQAVRT